MSQRIVGLLHPGEMGVSIGSAAKTSGCQVLWTSQGRGPSTRKRALDANLTEEQHLSTLLSKAEIVISVCPPHAAIELAQEVAAYRYQGIFVDANAISPDSARKIDGIVKTGGAAFVDGGIIGPPATRENLCRMYLCGKDADEVAAVFLGSLLDARVVTGQVGQASALKMAYAAWTKGSDALMLAIRALATHEGVESALMQEWALSQPELATRSNQAATGSAPKAWRFAAEMREIANTFEASGLPCGFHQAAAEIFERLKDFKHATAPSVDQVTEQIIGQRK